MRKAIRCYHMFLPGNSVWLKIVLYLGYPLLLLGAVLGNQLILRGWIPAYLCIFLVTGMVLVAEIVSDFFIYGGITSKDTGRLEYLKTSTKVKAVLTKSLIVDAARRFFSIGCILTGTFFLVSATERKEYGIHIRYLVELILAVYLLSTVAVGITRCFTLIWANVLACALMREVFAVLWWLLFRMQKGYAVVIALFVILSAGAAIWNVRNVRNRLQKSYFEERK